MSMMPKKDLLPPTKWTDPDDVCEAEYRVIHELCSAMWEEEQDIEVIRSILYQLRDTVEYILQEGKG